MDHQNAQHSFHGPGSAEDLIARAQNSEPLAIALPEQPASSQQDAWMEAAFAALPASSFFDPAVLKAVDLLMQDSESVTVQARQRLVGGADRGVRWRHRLDSHIGNLLRDRRCTLELSPGEVAAKIGSAAALIAEIETGAKPIESLPADLVAAWIQLVSLAPAVALAALQNASVPDEASASSLDGPASRFTCDVAAALGWSNGRR
ncbi:MAG TPA: hypothetical protein VNF47_01385 [Streptosporangiaceae bacterium]|nr:hypothetical protein [Streptosporangiaceae bacterium]